MKKVFTRQNLLALYVVCIWLVYFLYAFSPAGEPFVYATY